MRFVFLCLAIASLTPTGVTAAPPRLDMNDVTWLWPVPESEADLEQSIAIASIRDDEGNAVWTDQQFGDVLKVADSNATVVGDHRIGLPEEVRNKAAWRIVAFRVDPSAPGGHEIIRNNFGERPQIRLILQPVTKEGENIQVHDIAIHLVYSFEKAGDEASELPDRERFQTMIADLDDLKAFVESANVTTTDVPLGVHPGLAAKLEGLPIKVQAFLSKHLKAKDLSAMALMGLDGPEPWIFIAMSQFPPGAEHFGPVPFLPAQMLSFRNGPGEVLPVPSVDNTNIILSKIPMPQDAAKRRGVATAVLFNDSSIDLDALAVVGVDDQGQPVTDPRIHNKDIPDIIADPTKSHFFNTDCLSCHTETRRRIRFSLDFGEFAFLRDGKSPPIDSAVMPQHDWNVRNLGWFPPSEFIGGGSTVPTVTQRTANETAEVVAFIEQHYRQSAPQNGATATAVEAEAESPSPQTGTRYLAQGWNQDERQDFYYLTQGSQLIPYLWFLSLEQPANQELLRSDSYLASLGCIPQPPSLHRNPDGLPIGFVRNSKSIPIEQKRALLGSAFEANEMPKTSEWLGFTCAACHTADLRFKGNVVRIDGGAAMFDLESFLEGLAKSMRATLNDGGKFSRFEKNIKANNEGDIDTTGLRDELEVYTPVIERLVERNKSDHRYGLARLDAFGAILNQICEGALEISENRHPSNAPVSYPFLWDTPQLDWVQWNSSVEVPVARNVGEVLGVFAHVQLTGTPETGQYSSSANPINLHRLEVQLRNLRAPGWPEDLLGKIDQEKAAAGKVLFANNCAKCHNTRDENGNFAMTEPNEHKRSFIKTTSVPFNKIGTDPLMAVNFITRTAKPGDLADVLNKELGTPEEQAKLRKLEQTIVDLGKPRPDFTKEVPAARVLAAAVRGVITRAMEPELSHRTEEERKEIMLDMRGHRSGNDPPNGGAGYKARPLNGVWATAPFGHAGAVPNLYQWLLPQDQRVKKFFISDRDFDTKHVGFDTEVVTDGFEFKTIDDEGKPIPGNSNLGHSGPGHTGPIQSDQNGRDFTDDERWELIEYIKTLR